MRIILSIMFLLVSTVLSAQFDTNYVHKTKNQFMAFPLLESANTTMYYDLVNADKSNTSASYSSRNFNSIGFGASFYRLGFSFSFELPTTNIPELKGKKAFNFKGGYSYRKFYGELKIRSYNGVEEYQFGPDSNSTISKLRLDIKMRQYGVQVYYFFSKKYNYDANFKNYNIQKKSAISPYFNMGNNYYYTIGNNLFSDTATSYEFLTKIQNYSLRFIPGFSFSIVYKHLYFSAMGGIGVAINRNIVDVDKENYKSWNLTSIYELNAAIGYSNPSYFITLVYSYEYDNVKIASKNIGAKHNLLSFKMGKRFNSKYLGKIGKYL